MRSRVMSVALPLGRQAFVRLTAHLYHAYSDIAGYYSRVVDTQGNAYGHILCVDIDGGNPTRIWDALLSHAYDAQWPDAWLFRTSHGYHALSTGIFDAPRVTQAYHALYLDGVRVDWRHLGVGLTRGTWTLRFGPKEPGDAPVRFIAYERGSDLTWSEGHWRLLRALAGRPLEAPTGKPIRSLAPLVRYRG